jgi:lysophospholipase L1-like esterase
LEAEYPRLRVEVVNLAYDGYDAYQIWQRLLWDGIPMSPDAIIVNAGVNDVRNAYYPGLGDPDPRTLIWEGEMRRQRDEQALGGPSVWTRLKRLSYVARLPGLVRQRIAMARAASAATPTHEPYATAAINFSVNLGRIAGVAASLGVPLVLSTPPSALLLPDAPSMEPRGYWLSDRATTQRYRDTLAARMQAAVEQARARGQRATYIAPRLPGRMFLDDCHLTPEGNRAMAREFADAVAPYLSQR